MHNVLTLLKLEFRNKFGKVSFRDAKSIFKIITACAFLVVIFCSLLWCGKTFFSMFKKAGLEYEVLVLFFSVVFLFLLITNISTTIKVLYYKGDNEILMRFPVSGTEVFWAKTIFLLISQIIMTVVLLVPFLLAYAKVVPVTRMYFATIPFVILFMVFIPFFIANILAIPFMQASNKIRHKFGLIILSLAVLMTAIFFVYTVLFEKVVIYLQDGQNFSVFDAETVTIISEMIKYFIPTKYLAGMMLGEFQVSRIINRETIYRTVGDTRELSYAVFIIITELSMVGTYFVTKKLYQKTLLANVEIEGSAYKKVTKNRARPIFFTLLHKEFLQVFRSVNYSFQYFVLACSMPVMVFFCNRIAIGIGTNDIGFKIIPGLTLLIMLIFNTVIISFSATSITREGNNFYHTKVMPVSVRKQLRVKFAMYNMVSFLANIITVLIIIFSKQMVEDLNAGYEFYKPIAIYIIVTLLSIGMTLRSMRFDIKKPRFNLNGEGELVNNNTNTTNSVLLGFIIALFFGVLGMLIPYLISGIGFEVMFYILFGCAFIFFIYAFLSYNIKLTATYNKIV